METLTIVAIVATIGTAIGGILTKFFVDRVWDFSLDMSQRIKGTKRRRSSTVRNLDVKNTPVVSSSCLYCC